MIFYKILYCANKKKILDYDLFECDLLFGLDKRSFGICYSPQKYNELLSNQLVFDFFVKNSIKQAIMTNYKFIKLINFQSEFNLELVDFKCRNEIGYNNFLEEDLDLAHLGDWIADFNLEILQVYFRLKNTYLISIKSNGVLGFDVEAYDIENYCFEKLINFLSFGSRPVL